MAAIPKKSFGGGMVNQAKNGSLQLVMVLCNLGVISAVYFDQGLGAVNSK